MSLESPPKKMAHDGPDLWPSLKLCLEEFWTLPEVRNFCFQYSYHCETEQIMAHKLQSASSHLRTKSFFVRSPIRLFFGLSIWISQSYQWQTHLFKTQLDGHCNISEPATMHGYGILWCANITTMHTIQYIQSTEGKFRWAKKSDVPAHDLFR